MTNLIFKKPIDMKFKILSICLIVLGAFVILNSTRTFVGRFITSKEVSCERIKHQIQEGVYSNTIDLEKLYIEKRIGGLRDSIIQFGLGLILLLVGIIWLYNQNSLTFSWKPRIFEIGLNLLYWFGFALIIGFLVSGGGKRFTSCTIDWIYIFLVAGLTGYYSSYFYVYNQLKKDNRWTVTFSYGLLFSLIGCILSYFPFGLYSSIASGNYKPLFSIQMILVLGFFAFISFIHVYIGLIIKRIIMKRS